MYIFVVCNFSLFGNCGRYTMYCIRLRINMSVCLSVCLQGCTRVRMGVQGLAVYKGIQMYKSNGPGLGSTLRMRTAISPEQQASSWHSRRTENWWKPYAFCPLLPRRVQTTPLSSSSTQHMWELLAGSRTAVLPWYALRRWIRHNCRSVCQ